MELSKPRMEACLRDIDLWMVQNRLKLNQEKTKVLVFLSSHRPRPDVHDLTIVDEIVNCSSTAKDIGVVLGDHIDSSPWSLILLLCVNLHSSTCTTYPRLGSFLLLKLLLKLCTCPCKLQRLIIATLCYMLLQNIFLIGSSEC